MAPPSPVSVMSDLSEAWQRFSRDRRGDDWSVDSRKYITDFLPFKVATSTSEPGLRTTWSFLRLLIFGTCGPKHFLCHPFLTKLPVISPWWQLEDWHKSSGDWWHQTMPISVISEILTQLHNVPAAAPWPPVYRDRCWLVVSDHVVTGAGANWSQHLNWLQNTLWDNILHIYKNKNFTLQQMHLDLTSRLCVGLALQIETENRKQRKKRNPQNDNCFT